MYNRREILKLAAASPLLILSVSPVLAATPEVFSSDGLAIHGYDPVAYFKKDGPVEGSKAYALKWMGVTWYFSSVENMAEFETNPHGYAPQYGGYCAYAMAQGAIAKTVPEAWTIHDGKLFLNFSTGVRGIWKKDIPGNIVAANVHWPSILNK